MKERQHRKEVLRVAWNDFAWLARVYCDTAPLEDPLIETFGVRARDFIVHLKLGLPWVSITPKLHYLGNHYVEFMRKYRGMGRFAEQGLERMHQVQPVRGFKGAQQLMVSCQKHEWSRESRGNYPDVKPRDLKRRRVV